MPVWDKGRKGKPFEKALSSGAVDLRTATDYREATNKAGDVLPMNEGNFEGVVKYEDWWMSGGDILSNSASGTTTTELSTPVYPSSILGVRIIQLTSGTGIAG